MNNVYFLFISVHPIILRCLLECRVSHSGQKSWHLIMDHCRTLPLDLSSLYLPCWTMMLITNNLQQHDELLHWVPMEMIPAPKMQWWLKLHLKATIQPWAMPLETAVIIIELPHSAICPHKEFHPLLLEMSSLIPWLLLQCMKQLLLVYTLHLKMVGWWQIMSKHLTCMYRPYNQGVIWVLHLQKHSWIDCCDKLATIWTRVVTRFILDSVCYFWHVSYFLKCAFMITSEL